MIAEVGEVLWGVGLLQTPGSRFKGRVEVKRLGDNHGALEATLTGGVGEQVVIDLFYWTQWHITWTVTRKEGNAIRDINNLQQTWIDKKIKNQSVLGKYENQLETI